MRFAILACTVCGILACSANAAFWDVELVYDGGLGAGDCSLALDGIGVPHISYTEDGALYYASKTIGGWSAERVTDVGYWGGLSCLAFDCSGFPCIAFVNSNDPATNYLCFARKTTMWSVEVVADVGWLADHVSLAISPHGQACIAFCRTIGSNAVLSFARRLSQGQWSIEDIASVGSVTGPCLGFTASGEPIVAFVDSGSGALKVARASGSAWTVTTVDGDLANFAVPYPSFATDNAGFPEIAYFLSTSSSSVLRLAKYVEYSWQKETVASFGSPVYCAHVAAGTASSGIRVVCFQSPESCNLKAAWQIGSRWICEDIDSAPVTGLKPMIRCNNSGEIYLCYFDGFEFNVKFARALAPLTIHQAKSKPDGALVHMDDVVASTGSSDFSNTIYVQSRDRTCGLKLQFTSSTPTISSGQILQVQGELCTTDGERVLIDPIVGLR